MVSELKDRKFDPPVDLARVSYDPRTGGILYCEPYAPPQRKAPDPKKAYVWSTGPFGMIEGTPYWTNGVAAVMTLRCKCRYDSIVQGPNPCRSEDIGTAVDTMLLINDYTVFPWPLVEMSCDAGLFYVDVRYVDLGYVLFDSTAYALHSNGKSVILLEGSLPVMAVSTFAMDDGSLFKLSRLKERMLCRDS